MGRLLLLLLLLLLLSFLFSLLLTLLFFSLFFFPVISFAAEYNDELGGTGRPPSLARDRADTGGGSDAEDERAVLTGTYSLVFLFSLLPTLFFFSLLFFPVISFAAEYNDELGGRQQKHGAGQESNGCVFCCCCCFLSLSTLSFSSSYLTLLFFYHDFFLRDVQNIVQQTQSHATRRDRLN